MSEPDSLQSAYDAEMKRLEERYGPEAMVRARSIIPPLPDQPRNSAEAAAQELAGLEVKYRHLRTPPVPSRPELHIVPKTVPDEDSK